MTMLAVVVTIVVALLSWFVFGVYDEGQKLSSMPRVPRPQGLAGLLLGNLQDLTNKRYHRTSFHWTQRCGKVARVRILWSQVRPTCSSPFRWPLILLLVLTDLRAACQIVLVADPHIITELLRDKTWDKSKRAYSVMNAVQLCDLA